MEQKFEYPTDEILQKLPKPQPGAKASENDLSYEEGKSPANM